MSKDLVEQYIAQELIPQIEKKDLNKEQIRLISEDISLRLKSLLACWHDRSYLAPLFELVKEEALFYTPKSHISIRCLVVLGIRNSSIEDVHSTHPLDLQLKTSEKHVAKSSDFIQEITSKAITFFKGNVQRSDNFSSMYKNELFFNFNEKYPRAWRLLERMNSIKTTEIEQGNLPVPEITELIKNIIPSQEITLSAVVSGIDNRLDQGLLSHLKTISDSPENSIFLVPSFKHISRNTEKNLKVLEFLLYIDVPLVTPNYLCTTSKVSIRSPLLQPIHNNREFKKVLMNLSGVKSDHAIMLKSITTNLD